MLKDIIVKIFYQIHSAGKHEGIPIRLENSFLPIKLKKPNSKHRKTQFSKQILVPKTLNIPLISGVKPRAGSFSISIEKM